MARKKAAKYVDQAPEFTLEERVEMLENGTKVLVEKLRSHGIHLESAAEPAEPEVETEEEQED
jgi:hypothetical protein